MAKEQTKKVTFYAYSTEENILRKRPLSLEYPVQQLIKGRDRHDDTFMCRFPTIIFEKGVYETDIPEIIDFLNKYNIGGELENEKDALGRPFKINPDYSLARILQQAPTNTSIIEKEVIKTVEIVKIPRSMLSMFDIKQLRAMFVELQVALPAEDNLTKEELIAILETEGRIG